MTNTPERIYAWLDQGPKAREVSELEGDWVEVISLMDNDPGVHEYVLNDKYKDLEAHVQKLEAVVQDFAPVQPDGTKERMPHKVRRLSLRVNELEASAVRIANIKLWLDEQDEECDAEALDDLSRLLWQNKGLQKKKRNHV